MIQLFIHMAKKQHLQRLFNNAMEGQPLLTLQMSLRFGPTEWPLSVLEVGSIPSDVTQSLISSPVKPVEMLLVALAQAIKTPGTFLLTKIGPVGWIYRWQFLLGSTNIIQHL